jgi:hypothetical protein
MDGDQEVEDDQKLGRAVELYDKAWEVHAKLRSKKKRGAATCDDHCLKKAWERREQATADMLRINFCAFALGRHKRLGANGKCYISALPSDVLAEIARCMGMTVPRRGDVGSRPGGPLGLAVTGNTAAAAVVAAPQAPPAAETEVAGDSKCPRAGTLSDGAGGAALKEDGKGKETADDGNMELKAGAAQIRGPTGSNPNMGGEGRADETFGSSGGDCNELVGFLKTKGLRSIAAKFSEGMGMELVEDLKRLQARDLEDADVAFLKRWQKEKLLELASGCRGQT